MFTRIFKERRLAVALVAILIATGCAQSDANARHTKVHITRVIDGDTIAYGPRDNETKIRVLGINTPESDQCGGRSATDATKKLVLGKDVRLIYAGQKTDRYGRLLRYVEVDGKDLGYELIGQGLADAYYDSIIPRTAAGKQEYPKHPREKQYHDLDDQIQDIC